MDGGQRLLPTRAECRRRAGRGVPNAAMTHALVHALCVNQVEIYFWDVQRWVVLLKDFTNLAQVGDQL